MRTITSKDFWKHSERASRLSVDIDDYQVSSEPLKTLRVFYTLKKAFPKDRVTADRTRNGFHVKAVGANIAKIPLEKRILYREILGDDSPRVDYEKLKMQMGLEDFVDTLFTLKIDHDGSVGHVEENVSLAAAPWMSRIPCRKT